MAVKLYRLLIHRDFDRLIMPRLGWPQRCVARVGYFQWFPCGILSLLGR